MPRQSAEISKKIDAKHHKISKKTFSASERSSFNSADQFKMISEAAYYRALARGFNGGDPVEDWLIAESEIESIPHGREEPEYQPSFD